MYNFKKLFIGIAVCVASLLFFAGFAYADADRKGVVNTEVLNLRESPDTSSRILVQLDQNTQLTIKSESNGWYNVSYDSITGWVRAEFVTLKDSGARGGVITGSVVNVRENPDTSSKILTQLEKGDRVSVTGDSGGWYKVRTPDGITGWISKEYLSLKEQNISRGDEEQLSPAEINAIKDKKDSKDDLTAGQKVVNYAKKFLGVKYVWGGNTPSGFDCSGFVKYVFTNFGVDLERVACNQAKQGAKVSRDNLQAGDLVFFDTNGGHSYINHVGMYIGDGKFIHAASSRSVRKVTITELNRGFYSNAYITARRFIK